MTPAREKQIRLAWSRSGPSFDFGKRPRWVMLLRPERSVLDFSSAEAIALEAMPEVATCSVEHGWEDGRKSSRVVCEGLVLAQRFYEPETGANA